MHSAPRDSAAPRAARAQANNSTKITDIVNRVTQSLRKGIRQKGLEAALIVITRVVRLWWQMVLV
jgi:hypothetical protein